MLPVRREQYWSDSFSELEKLQKEMNRLFDFSLSRYPSDDVTMLGGEWAPAIDMYDSKDNILVKADLPGLSKEEINISVEDNNLVIKGEKKKEIEHKDEKYQKSERYHGSFYRTIPLPVQVDADKVEAVYKEGVLSLTLPKNEQMKPKRISIDIK